MKNELPTTVQRVADLLKTMGHEQPIGHVKPSIVLIDQSLSGLESVWAAAGHPHAVFNVTPTQLSEMTAARLVDVALAS